MTKEEERFISGALLKMCDDLVGKLKERDTTLTFTYEVDDTKGDDVKEDEIKAISASDNYFKLEIVRLVYNNSDAIDDILEDAEKVYKWVNK